MSSHDDYLDSRASGVNDEDVPCECGHSEKLHHYFAESRRWACYHARLTGTICDCRSWVPMDRESVTQKLNPEVE